MTSRLSEWFFRPADGAALAVFRVLFGGLILFEAVNYGIFLDLDEMYRDPAMLFKYHYFEWAVLPPGPWLSMLFLVMGMSAIGVMLGLWYRFSAIVMVATFTYHFWLDQALYLNHFYLAILFAAILVFVPAHHEWSLSPAARRSGGRVPNWSYIWLIAQLEIVLLYAGFVKLNMDWLQLEPMRLWMNAQSRDEAAFFQWLTQDWGIALASYGVIALHLIGAPLLLFKRTRLVVFIVYCVFHTINAFVFNIGIFPWMTLGATLLMFDKDWPRQLLRRWQQRGHRLRWPQMVEAVSSSSAALVPSVPMRWTIIVLITVWLAAQVFVPLRHYTRPGNVAWNEDGHRFSWRMKLRSKRGWARFHVVGDGVREVVDPADYLNVRQVRKMACIPDLIWQFAQFLEEEFSARGQGDVRVHADTACSLNTREPQPLINRMVDLTAIERDEPPSNWVTPLSKPFPNPIF